MDSLHFCIAVIPLAVYLLMMGLLNLRRRPFVTTGARDAATLGIGVVGFVIAGPMELFFSRRCCQSVRCLGVGVADHFLWLVRVVDCVVNEATTGGLQRFAGRATADPEQDCDGAGPKESLDWRCTGDPAVENSHARGGG